MRINFFLNRLFNIQINTIITEIFIQVKLKTNQATEEVDNRSFKDRDKNCA